jgi:ubiquinone/menaquinone biosynthesis C-methylase UbiE
MSQSPESLMSYEAAVHWMRSQPEFKELVSLSYLDEDNKAAAVRFAACEEFAELARWAQLNKKGAPKSILDVGCGNGIASYAMGILGHKLTSLDPDLSADVGLEAAKRLVPIVEENGGSMECVQGFVEDLQFPTHTFDVVYTRQAVHHFSDLDGGLRECKRVLKKGGLFIATREHVVNDEGQLQQFLAEHTLHHKHGGENAYPLEVYVSALEKAGFEQIQVFGPWDSVVNHFPESNAKVRSIISNGIRKRFKLPIDLLALQIPGFEANMRRRLSAMNNHPGRLYSFVASA